MIGHTSQFIQPHYQQSVTFGLRGVPDRYEMGTTYTKSLNSLPFPGSSCTISRTRVAHYLPYSGSPLSPVPEEPTISRTHVAHYLPYPGRSCTTSRTRGAHYLLYPGSSLSPVPVWPTISRTRGAHALPPVPV